MPLQLALADDEEAAGLRLVRLSERHQLRLLAIGRNVRLLGNAAKAPLSQNRMAKKAPIHRVEKEESIQIEPLPRTSNSHT